jgi:hypothetical protein
MTRSAVAAVTRAERTGQGATEPSLMQLNMGRR